MIDIHLLVEESYIEELMMLLPKDKVKVVEKNFEENKILLQESLESYANGSTPFKGYNESVKDLNVWLEGKK